MNRPFSRNLSHWGLQGVIWNEPIFPWMSLKRSGYVTMMAYRMLKRQMKWRYPALRLHG